MDLKEKFYQAAQDLIVIYGFSDELLKQVALATELQNNIFVNIKDFVSYHLTRGNQNLADELQKIDIDELKIRDRIKTALMIRFKAQDKDIFKEELSFLAKPQNLDLSFKSIADLSDKIWCWAGDRSTDYNYYSKRTLLGTIYSAAIIHYVRNDDSDLKDLENFITKRIENVMQLGKLKQKIME